MTSLLIRAATQAVRGWTRFCTQALPRATRERRRAEIESDLWELQRDVAGHETLADAARVLVRLVSGVPDDLGWWVEQATATGVLCQKTIVVTGRFVGMAIVAAALWAIGHDISRERTAVAFAPGLVAQSPAGDSSGVRFEVISVKPNPTGRAGTTQMRLLPGGRFVGSNVQLRLLIGRAYGVPSYRLIGGPGWIETDAFDIVATANRDLSPAGGQRPLDGALRGLLAERFKLIVHTETRRLPAYDLMFARGDRKTWTEPDPLRKD